MDPRVKPGGDECEFASAEPIRSEHAFSGHPRTHPPARLVRVGWAAARTGAAAGSVLARKTLKEFVTFAYDALAPSFERHRALPDGVAEAIRAAILAAIDASSRPRLLDLGAGTGRIGRPFVAAGDDYVGLDVSFGMLRAFVRRAAGDGQGPRLVQSDGELLPFRDATFDAVMLIQVFGGMRGWRRLVGEARRVLQPAGALVIGRSVAPADGIDAQMRQRLAPVLGEMGVQAERNMRDDVQHWLDSAAREKTRVVAAAWTADRTPRGFIDRHRTGARFSALPEAVKEKALRTLGAWAAETFGSLDATFSEPHTFELRIYRFHQGTGR
jgi:ubiquinone/menaquinone biosynthesis C-methylase UbiE